MVEHKKADNKVANHSMFWRLIFRAIRLRLQRVLIIFTSLTVGASIVTAMAAVYFDINTKMSQELRTFGANFYIGSADGGMINEAELNAILQNAQRFGKNRVNGCEFRCNANPCTLLANNGLGNQCEF